MRWIRGDRQRWSELTEALLAAGFQIADEPAAGESDLGLIALDRDSCSDGEIEREIASAAAPVVALCPDADRDLAARACAAGAIVFVLASEPTTLAVERVQCALAAVRLAVEQRRRSQEQTSEGSELATRATFLRGLEAALVRARENQRGVAVLVIDLDRFRQLASSLSAAGSETLIAAFVARLRDGIRHGDSLARPAGDSDTARLARVAREEFSILLEGLARIEDAAKVARRIHDLVEAPFHVEGHELCVTLSIGIAGFPSDEADAEGLLKCAETAAFSAKQIGPGGIQFYSPALNARAFERMTLETQLRHAVERAELVVFYQPRLDVQSGRIVGVEALLRWQHPQLGLVAPAEFIPLAEETGLIVPIGEWVLATACAQAKRWQQRGFAPLAVSVNLSPVQFRSADLYASVLRALHSSGLDPRWLELELTETVLMHNAESVAATLARLRDAGVTLSIDDFGTGYSSLSYLRRFPIDAIKIDRTFLRDVASDPDDASIVTAIILMAKSLRLRIVAEGVENEAQLAFLRIMQCDEAQGFLFSRPVPPAELEHLLEHGVQVAAA